MMKLLKGAAIAGALAITTGCASIITDETAAINVVTSNNQQATVSVDGQAYQVPGVVLATKDGQDKILVADGKGCDANTVVPTKIEGAFWGNILIGGLLGSTTDSATNKMWTYQETVTINCSGS